MKRANTDRTFQCECLQPDGSQRLGPFDILLSDSFKLDNSIITNWKRSDLAGNFPTLKLRCQNLNWPPENEISIENETALDVLSLQVNNHFKISSQ